MVRHDSETVFQQIKELGMTGKGWVWIGTDGAISSTFNQQKDLERTMEGMIGTQPKNGDGSIYLSFLASWLKKDSTTYPGIVHSKSVSLKLPCALPVVFNPFTPKSAKFKTDEKILNFILQNCQK